MSISEQYDKAMDVTIIMMRKLFIYCNACYHVEVLKTFLCRMQIFYKHILCM